MILKNKKLHFKKIIYEQKYYFLYSYILVTIGFIISSFYKPPHHYIIYILTIGTIPFSCFFLEIIYFDILKNKEVSQKFIKLYLYTGRISLILLPLFVGFYYNLNNPQKLELNIFITTIITSLLISLAYSEEIRKRIIIKRENESIKLFLILTGTFLITSIFKDSIIPYFNYLITIIITNITNYLTIGLAVILLCATLSLLAFTYCMILNNKSDIKNKMKKNGEYFFISTILSMLIMLTLGIISFITPKLTIINLKNITYASLLNFIGANTFIILIIITLFSFSYIIYYMIIGSYSSLKLLKQE